MTGMTLSPSVSKLFKWRQSEPEIILMAVGWYLRFSLSYRDVEELLADRGFFVDHATIWRWVQRPLFAFNYKLATLPKILYNRQLCALNAVFSLLWDY
jgi:hypothetical protein